MAASNDARPDGPPDTVDNVALARLYGEPLFRLPDDLYIPPDALEIFLEAFEGPLDLLLYLIRKQHFNVLDIPMAPLTLQYLTYIDQIRAKNLELAAEYLLMAALLIEIKSRMLLPVRKADSGEDAEDPRAELVRRLLEYERMKLAAQRLDELPRIGRDFLRAAVVIEQSLEKRFPQVNVIDLRDAWARRRRARPTHCPASYQPRRALGAGAHEFDLESAAGQAKFIEFGDLFDPARGAAVAIVHFLALLELAREALIDITQAAPFAPIYIRLAYTPS